MTFSTHNKGHTLDHAFTESGIKMIVDCKSGIYISDHRSVMAEVSVRERSEREYLKSHQNREEVEKPQHRGTVITWIDSIDECVKLMEGEVKRSLYWFYNCQTEERLV